MDKLIYKLMFFFLIIGMIFTNLPFFPQYTVTHSLMFVIAPLCLFIILVVRRFRLFVSDNIKIFIVYGITSFLSSLVLLWMAVLSKNGEFYAYGKNLLIKSFEGFFSLYVLHLITYLLLLHIFLNIHIRYVKIYVTTIFILLTITGIIEYAFPEIIDIFHETSKQYERLRLFTMEPSQATLIYSVVGLLTLFFIKNVFLKALTLIIFLYIQFLIQSKAFWISLTLTTMIVSLKNNSRVIKFLYFLTFLFLILFFLNFALPSLIIDIKNFTSFATRTSTIVSNFLVLLYYPIGMGYGTYLLFYPEILQKSFEFLDSILQNFFNTNLLYWEIETMILTGENLSAKGSLSQFIMLNGWLGLVFFFGLLYKTIYYISKLRFIVKDVTNIYFLILLMFIQLAIGTDFILQYIIWLPVALVEALYIRYKLEEVKNE